MERAKALISRNRTSVREAATRWRSGSGSRNTRTYRFMSAAYRAASEIDDAGLARRFLCRDVSPDLEFAAVIDDLLRGDAKVTCRRTRWKLAAAIKFAETQAVEPKKFTAFLRVQGGINACARRFSHREPRTALNSWTQTTSDA